MLNSIEQTVIKNPTWWKRMPVLDHGLLMMTVFAVLLSRSLVIGMIVVAPNSDSFNETSNNIAAEPLVCSTSGCKLAAEKVRNDLDQNVKPCDNFYRFACGGFLNSTVIPGDKIRVSSSTLIHDEIQEQLRASIEDPSLPNEPKPFRLAKNLYKICMDKKAIEKQGLDPLLKLLKQLGGWPVLEGETWNENKFDWILSTYKFRDMGYSYNNFLAFSIDVDMRNSTQRVIHLDQASLGLRQQYLSKGWNEKIVKSYYNSIVNIAVILGADKAYAEKEINASLAFEMQLANISLPEEKRRNITLLYNQMNITELLNQYPSIPWREYFNRLLPSNVRVQDDEIVIVVVPKYIKDLENLLKNTPKRTQANYAIWRAVYESVIYLTEEVRKEQFAITTALRGNTVRVPRWKECVSIVSKSFSLSMGALYARKYFHEDAKKNAVEMVARIRNRFENIINNISWMDDETKNSALDKLMSMSSHIAYPDELLDDSKLEEFYKNVELAEDNYLQSILKLNFFDTGYSFSKLRRPVNKNDWEAHSEIAIVNACYSLAENSIQMPAGILQGNFFNNDRPNYMNYGAIGVVIGHEITHSFDDEGRQFDKGGNLDDWWAHSTNEQYLEKISCIIDQYKNYKVEEVNATLNGFNTQGENIADNGGIKGAYYAYLDWTKENGQEQRLPGLDWSPRQMFWISAASIWCSKYRPEYLNSLILTGEHSPAEFRVLGPFSNMPEFSKDFNCPIGSKMNPEKKCSVW